MQESPLLRLVTILLLSAITSTALHPQSTKKGSSGDQSSSTGDQSGADVTNDGSGGTKDKTSGKDASKSDDKSKGDTSKTGFDDGTYAEATAITYKAMQSIGSGIAAKRNTTANTFVVFDPTTFANIAQYRIQFPQIVLLRKSLCGALTIMDKEINNEKKARQEANQVITRPTFGAGASLAGLSPAGQIVDLAQKVLTMMQTTTTIAGASVNVTDEALVTEVAASLHKLNTDLAVYYPGEFLLPDIGESDINKAMNANWCQDAPDLGQSHHIVAEVVRLGVARQEAATRYQLLTAALDKYNSAVTPSAKKANTDQTAPTDKTVQTDKDKKKKKPNGTAGASPAPAPAASDATQTHEPTVQEKKDALDQFFAETGFTDTVKATGYQTNLKSYMDAYDALLTSLATPDTKGQTMFSRLVIAERLDSILKPSPIPDPNDATKTIPSPVVVNVVIVKWLRAGALNKTRKNLFFLGQRNYYAGGATALYEYFDGDQKMLASGTITETSPYVHDKDFDKKKSVTMIDLATTP
jgi:hypothetical protein